MSRLQNKLISSLRKHSYRCHSTEARHLVSKLHLQFNDVDPKKSPKKHDEISSKSHRMLVDFGLIRQQHNGSFALLPLMHKSLQKLQKLIDEQMFKIGANKMLLPTMTDGGLWKKSGRWKLIEDELFKLKNRHDQDFVLGPTYEEAITQLIASYGIVSSKDFPMKFYQISSKFRDEKRAAFGLIRSKEFIMKDLYTFDATLENARDTYELVNESYKELFDKLAVPYAKVQGETGAIGGSLSHEYHFLSPIGQDDVIKCLDCDYSSNLELLKEQSPQCSRTNLSVSQCNLQTSKGIEVGHTFLLGDKYSKIFKARCLSQGQPALLQMGCYGLGVTRILAASLEVLSTDQSLIWPASIVPYKVAILAPKGGSKEEAAISEVYKLYDQLVHREEFKDDVIIDDRVGMTVGKKLREAKKIGYTYIVLFGKECIDKTNPVIEFYGGQDEVLKLGVNQVLYHLEQINTTFK